MKLRGEDPLDLRPREIVLLVTVAQGAEFASKLRRLEAAWGTLTAVETFERALDEAIERLASETVSTES